MTWLSLLLVAVLALAPLLLLALRRSAGGRERRDAALGLHRAQLLELDRDRDEGRIAPADHATAVLEVQRRLLADAGLSEPPARTSTRLPLLMALAAVPLLAAGLYLIAGHPDLPAAPLDARLEAARGDERTIELLRTKLASLDQDSAVARQGYVLLGNAEQARGNVAAAAAAWRQAVRIRFEPDLAALAAEAQTQADGGRVSAVSLDLYRRALAAAPPGAAWLAVVRQRIADESQPPKGGAAE